MRIIVWKIDIGKKPNLIRWLKEENNAINEGLMKKALPSIWDTWMQEVISLKPILSYCWPR